MAILVAALTLPLSVGGVSAAPAPSSQRSTAPAFTPPAGSPTNYSQVNYTTSTDPFNLSYYEWLPSGYNPTRSYPLIVFLHAVQGEGSGWTDQGLPSQIASDLSEATTDGSALRAIVNASMADGYLMITVNERTGAGFYANSYCTTGTNPQAGGGPQENDTLDAIAHEKELRLVGRVYLLGFGMGAIGSLALAASHPGMFAGVAVAGTITDGFEAINYRQMNRNSTNANFSWASASYATMLGFTCGNPPGPDTNSTNVAVDSIYRYLSAARLDPTTLATTPLYVVSGGEDNRAPNSLSYSSFLNVNNTFVNSTCQTFPGEPSNCSIPFAALHATDPSEYSFRDIYEPAAIDGYAQFNATDLFGWFNGIEPSGFYIANSWPPGPIAPITPENLQLTGPAPTVNTTRSGTLGMVGTTFNFTANASGPGGPPYSYSWAFGDGTQGSGSAVQHTFLVSGNFTVSVTVPGTAGGLTNAPVATVDVYPTLSGAILVAPGEPTATQTASVVAQLAGGLGQYICAWNFGDYRIGSGCDVSHAWAAAGQFEIRLYANDSVKHAIQIFENITVNATTPTKGGTTTPAHHLSIPAGWEGGLIVLLVAVAVIAVLYVRRQWRARPPPPSPPPAAQPGTP